MPKTSTEFRAFSDLLGKVVRVPRAAIQKRIEQHRAEALRNPRKRGPKPKVKV